MSTVGVRDLRDNLSQYLRRVREGELLVITDRGKPIGELGPAGRRSVAAPIEIIELDAVHLGKVRLMRRGVRVVHTWIFRHLSFWRRGEADARHKNRRYNREGDRRNRGRAK